MTAGGPEPTPAGASVRATVAAAWTAQLGTPPDDDSDFFDCGGHSLLAMALIDELQAQLDVEVPFQRFWAYATFAALCEIVEQERAAGG